MLTILSSGRRKQNPANPLTSRASVADNVYSAVLGMSLIFVVFVVVVVFLFNVHGKHLMSRRSVKLTTFPGQVSMS